MVRRIFSLVVVVRSAYGGKAALSCDNNAVQAAAGTMDNEDVAVGVPPAYDPYVGVAGVKHQVAGDGLAPCDRTAVVVLGYDASATTYHIGAAALVIERPIHKAGTVHTIGPVCPGGGAACGPYLHGFAP